MDLLQCPDTNAHKNQAWVRKRWDCLHDVLLNVIYRAGVAKVTNLRRGAIIRERLNHESA
jgi:hypothetical protein